MTKLLLALSFFLFVYLFTQPLLAQKKVYTTKHVNPHSPKIDGRLDDPAWDSVEWSTDFTQRLPNEGQAPSQETSFKILYDDDNLYVGVRAYDTEPEKIASQLSRRDHFPGDFVEINIDSRFDHQTAYSFTASVSGVRGDEFISQNGNNWDGSWDPIWNFKSNIDDRGWTAEMKIPFSQLRFSNKDEHIWGIQVMRNLFRKSERSIWQFVPQNSNGWVHLFGELHGLKGIKSSRQIELLPYTVGKYERFEKEEGNPFADGARSKARLGIDGKVGLSSDLILDFTVNPDFGQVEADPSQVNLTAFETYFQEKRPFFIEGRNIFNFQVARAAWGGSYSSDNLFYSRRIGRSPHYDPDTEDDEYVDFPENTSIVGAMKISGKTKSGLSIGVLESLTAREKAEIDYLGDRRQETVEPMTNYFVGRLQQDFDDGNTIIGGMFTATNRDITSSNLNYLHRSAYSGGLDLSHNWHDRIYYISGNTIFSHVRGDEEAILETQTSSRRYFQRPDAGHVEVDSSRTALSGYGGTIKFGRSGNFQFQTGLTWRSPGLELNDSGYQRVADEINEWTWISYNFTKPFAIFHRLHLNANTHSAWNFDRDNKNNLLNTNFNTEFKNYWGLNASLTYNFESLSTSVLRGGPAAIVPGGIDANFNVNSDQRKKLHGHSSAVFCRDNEGSSAINNFCLGLTYRPTNTLDVSVHSDLNLRDDELQYVDTVEFEAENQDRYIFAEIEQKTVSLTFRVNYSLTPDLSIEYYGSPFISAAEYSKIKRITDPEADQYQDRFRIFDDSEISANDEDEAYDFDEDRDGEVDYSVDYPDFNFREYNSNLVIRWQYSAGSTLYLVWSQGRSNEVSNGEFHYRENMKDLFAIQPHNVFLIKFSRWFSL